MTLSAAAWQEVAGGNLSQLAEATLFISRTVPRPSKSLAPGEWGDLLPYLEDPLQAAGRKGLRRPSLRSGPDKPRLQRAGGVVARTVLEASFGTSRPFAV